MMKNKKLSLFIFSLILSSLSLYGQNINNLLRKGNNAYKDAYYNDAIKHYKESFKLDSTNRKVIFALGDALYKTKDYKGAEAKFQSLLSDSLSRKEQAEVLHNLGNIKMKAKDYKSALELYKESIKLNPKDDQTRYNLVLAQKLIPKDKQQKQQQKDKEQSKDQNNKDKKKNKDKPKDNPKDNQKKKNEQKDKPKENKQDQEQQKQEQNRQQLEKLLDNYKDQDEKARQKMQKIQAYIKSRNKAKARKKW